MSFKLGRRSRENLIGVHPDLVRVVEAAITLSRVDFGVTEGVRWPMRQALLLESGKSQVKKSLHMIQPDGFSHAVDLYTRDENGKVTWEHKHFRWVIQAIFTSAIQTGVQVEAGGLWRDFLDSPHIQLNQRYYGDK